MNGVHDMGGMTDFGPVEVESDEPVFHSEWERRAFAIVRLTIDERYNWDEFRGCIERLDPVVYLSASYYERWFSALERFLIEKGDIDEPELRMASDGAAPRPGIPIADGSADDLPSDNSPEPRFKPGDPVTVRSMNPKGHTRLPRYVRGMRGTIHRFLDVETFPDRNALGLGEVGRPVYVVRFQARDLWGPNVSSRDTVCIDLWEDYLEPAA